MLENLRSRLQHVGLDLEQRITRKTHKAMGWTNNLGVSEVQIQKAVAQEATRLNLGKLEVKQFTLLIGDEVHPNATKVTDTQNSHLSNFWNAVRATRQLLGYSLPLNELIDKEKLSESVAEGVKIGYGVEQAQS